MSKLHLHAVTVNHVPERHGSVCIGATMLFFISVHGISPNSKRNVVLESIVNIFLVLNKDRTKIRHATSELCKHMFGNMHQERREFTCSEFSIIVDKQNIRIKLKFQSNLDATKDSATGHQEKTQEFFPF